MRSPCRFSSAVHCRFHLQHARQHGQASDGSQVQERPSILCGTDMMAVTSVAEQCSESVCAHEDLRHSNKPACRNHTWNNPPSVQIFVPAPGCVSCSSLVTHSIKRVQHGHVCWQGLLGDHITNKHNPVVIGQLVSPLPQLYHLRDSVRKSRQDGVIQNRATKPQQC